MTPYARIHVDPALPPVSTGLGCPGCGQTLAAIIDDGENLPAWHFPSPKPHSGRFDARIENKSPPPGACPWKNDHLARLIYLEQLEAHASTPASIPGGVDG